MSTETLPNLAAYLIQIAAITLIAELALRVVPVAAAGFRYAYRRLVLAGALVAPWMLRRTPAPVSDIAAAPVAAVEPAGGMFDVPLAPAEWTAGVVNWLDVLPWLFAAGVVARLVWVTAGLVRLRALRHEGARVDEPAYDEIQRRLGTRAEVRAIAGLAQPVTFGALRPVVLLPADLRTSEELRRAVVTHELVHVLRRDWLAVIAEELLRTVLWFHPAIWWLTSRVRLAREEFTDHLAVLATGSRRAYVEALLAFSESSPLDPAPAFARRAYLFRRIVTLSKEAAMSSRRVVVSGVLITALVASGGWYVSELVPVMKTPVLRAEAMADTQLPAAPPQSVNLVTPENPIPRRLSSTRIEYPAELNGTGFAATIELTVVVSAAGSVAAVSSSGAPARILGGPRSAGAGVPFTDTRRILETFVEAARDSIRQWQYDPPAKAPLEFYIVVTFPPDLDAAISQSDRLRGTGVAATPARSAAAVPPTPGQPIRIGGAIKTPIQTRKVNPEYPPIALSARVQGVVILELTIDQQGKVADARILRSIPLLDQAALDAVRQWEYTPTLLNGVPTPIVMTATVQFTLPVEPQ